MTAAALALFAAYLLFGFVIRTLLQWRATGDSGFRGIGGFNRWSQRHTITKPPTVAA